MKRVKPKPITELLKAYLRDEGLETPLLEHRIMNRAWPEVVGPYIAQQTENLSVSNQVLHVQCASAACRQEIVLQRSEIVRKLNLFVDAYVISDIVVR